VCVPDIEVVDNLHDGVHIVEGDLRSDDDR
jgi:hypothetical protein